VPHQSITSLIYVSTARAGLDQSDLLAIMTVAQRNNSRFGITGLILFNGFNFMQCVEGERGAVNDCLRRIERDDRHSGTSIVSRRELARRQFSDWRMAGQSVPPQFGLAEADVLALLSRETVNEATRTLFQSFLSFGIKPSD
jgi:hypothetical protein